MYMFLEKIKKTLQILFLGLPTLVPIVASAAVSTFSDLVTNIVEVLNSFIYLAMALATIYFLYGIIKYMAQYGDEKARSESAKTISYGLIALFVMVAVWGIIALIRMSLLGEGGVGIPQF